jgi:hypothetical protein
MAAAAAHRASHHPPPGGLVAAAAPGLSSDESAVDEAARRRHISDQEQLAVFREVVEEMIKTHSDAEARDWFRDTFDAHRSIPLDLKKELSPGNIDAETMQTKCREYLKRSWVVFKDALADSHSFI